MRTALGNVLNVESPDFIPKNEIDENPWYKLNNLSPEEFMKVRMPVWIEEDRELHEKNIRDSTLFIDVNEYKRGKQEDVIRRLHDAVRYCLELITKHFLMKNAIDFNYLNDRMDEALGRLKTVYVPSALNTMFELKNIVNSGVHAFDLTLQIDMIHLLNLSNTFVAMLLATMALDKSITKRKM